MRPFMEDEKKPQIINDREYSIYEVENGFVLTVFINAPLARIAHSPHYMAGAAIGISDTDEGAVEAIKQQMEMAKTFEKIYGKSDYLTPYDTVSDDELKNAVKLVRKQARKIESNIEKEKSLSYVFKTLKEVLEFMEENFVPKIKE